MKVGWVRVPRVPPWPGWPGLLAIIWLVSVLAGILVGHWTGHDVTLCLFKNATGYPCPTCGSTRLVFALAHGRLLRAFLWNPFVFVLTGVLIAWAVARLGFGRVLQFDMTRTQRRIALVLFLLALLVNWVYVLRAGN